MDTPHDEVDQAGMVLIKFIDGEMDDISFELMNLPKSNDACYFGIHAGSSCHTDVGEEYVHPDARRKLGEVWSYDDPAFAWSDETPFSTSHNGNAAGSFFGTNNGYSYSDNECKVLLVYDSDGDELACGSLAPEDGSCS